MEVLIMDFLDEMLSKAKDAIDVASKKKGEVVEVTVPAGLLKFEILDINI